MPIELTPIPSGSYSGRVTIADADSYFETRLGASTYWTATADKASALATAETMLEAAFTLPAADDADLTEAQAAAIARAIYEQALFLLRDPEGIDARTALQAQGVLSAGIVQETYGGSADVPVCAYARRALAAWNSNSITWER